MLWQYIYLNTVFPAIVLMLTISRQHKVDEGKEQFHEDKCANSVSESNETVSIV